MADTQPMAPKKGCIIVSIERFLSKVLREDYDGDVPSRLDYEKVSDVRNVLAYAWEVRLWERDSWTYQRSEDILGGMVTVNKRC